MGGGGAHVAGLDLAEIEQRIEHQMHRTHALLQIQQLRRQAVVAVLVDDGFDQKAHGVHRLAQIVAGGGQELVLVQQRLFRLLFSLPELFRQAGALFFEQRLLDKERMRG